MPKYRNEPHLAVPKSGGNLSVIDSDGEVIAEIGLSGGLYPLSDYDLFIPKGGRLGLTPQMTVLGKANKALKVMKGEFQKESGANPDYRPSRATPAEIELRKTLAQLTDRQNKFERSIRVGERLRDERIQRIKARESENAPEKEVVETVKEKPNKKDVKSTDKQTEEQQNASD